MIKGVDYTGVTVTFLCHDGKGEYVFHKRSNKCRDEHGMWDHGGGGLRFGETLEVALYREVEEEYGTKPISHEFMGFDEIMRVHEGKKTHWIAFRFKVLVEREKVINGEPEKIDEIGWFTLDVLPSPLHSVVPSVLAKYRDVLVS